MQILDSIVGQINAALTAKIQGCGSFASTDIYGIAEKLPRFNQQGQQQEFPTILTVDGKATFIGAEVPTKDLTLYHRIVSSSVGIASRSKTYGDTQYYRQIKFDMTLPIYYNRKNLRFDGHELAMWLIDAFPTTMKVDGLQNINIFVNNVVLSSLQVFQNEYRQVQYFVKPEHTLIAVSYQIENTFNTNCFNDQCPREKE